jgi:hypothetical protein
MVLYTLCMDYIPLSTQYEMRKHKHAPIPNDIQHQHEPHVVLFLHVLLYKHQLSGLIADFNDLLPGLDGTFLIR